MGREAQAPRRGRRGLANFRVAPRFRVARGRWRMPRAKTSVVAAVARAARGVLIASGGELAACIGAGLEGIARVVGAASIVVVRAGQPPLVRWPDGGAAGADDARLLDGLQGADADWIDSVEGGPGPCLVVPFTEQADRRGAIVLHFAPSAPRPPREVDDALELFGDLIGQALIREASVRTLGERERRYRTLADAAFEAIVIHRDRRIVDVNESACDLFGYARDQLLGTAVPGRYVAPDFVELVEGYIAAGYEGSYELDLLRSDGERIPVVARGRMVDRGERPTRVVALRDVRAERENAAQLFEVGERMRALLETAFEGFVVSRRGFVLDANEGFARMCGYTLPEVIGMTPGDVTTEEGARTILQNILAKVHEPYVVTGVRKDGSQFPMEIQGSECFYRGELVRITGFRDLTETVRKQEEQRRLEERMRQAQKLESLGMLAGGVAHDFNNLLVSVLGNADLALQDMDRDAPLAARLRHIRSAAVRASELTGQMLSYAGESRFEPQDVRLDRVASEMAELMRSSLAAGVRLELEAPPPESRVYGDATQIGQVVLNLLTNASEALGAAGGTVRLRYERLSVGDALPDEDPLDLRPAPGDYLTVVVEDDGPGMTPETRQRMFDPFFTTKFAGRGLGLASVLGIIKAHGGGVQVRSRLGQGTLIRVILPRSGTEAQPSGPHAVPVELSSLSGRVLLVDDDDDVRAVLGDMLTRAGLRVVEACDGFKGVDAYTGAGDRFDLVLLDLAMPGMGGEDVYDALVQYDAGVRVLFSSGFAPPPRVLAATTDPRRDYLRKPYRFRTLMERVAALLSATG